jgi:hypothetical protein
VSSSRKVPRGTKARLPGKDCLRACFFLAPKNGNTYRTRSDIAQRCRACPARSCGAHRFYGHSAEGLSVAKMPRPFLRGAPANNFVQQEDRPLPAIGRFAVSRCSSACGMALLDRYRSFEQRPVGLRQQNGIFCRPQIGAPSCGRYAFALAQNILPKSWSSQHCKIFMFRSSDSQEVHRLIRWRSGHSAGAGSAADRSH